METSTHRDARSSMMMTLAWLIVGVPRLGTALSTAPCDGVSPVEPVSELFVMVTSLSLTALPKTTVTGDAARVRFGTAGWVV